jgi:hypothetical protein
MGMRLFGNSFGRCEAVFKACEYILEIKGLK